MAVVELWPASSRPYIGGSQHNSFLELTFGYNGLGRLSGDETGSVGGGGARAAGGMELPAGCAGGGGGGGGGGWGATGIGRMFNSEIGGQISWLLPAALLLLVAGLVVTWKARGGPGRTDTARAAFLAWGGALLITAVVFSFMAGIFHQYYTVALGALHRGAGRHGRARSCGRSARGIWAALGLAVTVAGTAVWSYVLLDRTPDYLPWLRWAVLIGGLAAALGLALAGRLNRGAALGVAGGRLVASLAGPAAYTVSTLDTGHTGSIVTAGPAGASMGGARGRRCRHAVRRRRGRRAGRRPGARTAARRGRGEPGAARAGLPGGQGQAPTAPGQTGGGRAGAAASGGGVAAWAACSTAPR